MNHIRDSSLAELDKEGSLTSLLRISRSDESQSLTNPLESGGLLDALPQLLDTLHRLGAIPSPTIPNLHTNRDSSSSPSKKRKRAPELIVAATEKVQRWQADQDHVETEEPVAEAPKSNKRPRSMAPPPSPKFIHNLRTASNASHPTKDFSRPSQKKIRNILRHFKDFPTERIRMKHKLDETKEMLALSETVYQQNLAKLTEMQWSRYLIEEDVLRHQKEDRTLVDGTEKLGSASSQAREWRKWLQENTIAGH
ncbi:hypothetical protein FB446DRAFT_312162 [Lentinula raphanica]|nr:hypothetical protein FB446DRAFT_312162 [Lentinula raphanica]KAJ3828832.1 hypothetical protein F5880DRAFT_732971 [Lentinula raphanica]